MKFPVCQKCIKKNELCDKCKDIPISKEELILYKNIYNVLKNEEHIRDVEIKRIFFNEKLSIIVCKKQDVPKMIGKNGIFAKKIEKKLGKDIRIVSNEDELPKFIKDVLHPSTIIGINIVYDGDKEIYNIRLPSAERYLMKLDPILFKNIIEELFKKTVEIKFE
ncbi:MAG: KH domain-containing protein [Candidatus Aenigmatarchaeota archaeon]